MRSHSFLALVTFFVFVALPWMSVTAQPQPQADITVDNAGRTAVIDALLKELNEAYVFPEVAKKMEADIRGRASRGEYDEFTSGMKFAEKLTADLQGVSNDKHLRVRHSARPIPERTERTEPTAEERQQFERQMRLNNYGFRKVETLLGNIGYVEFRGFVDPKLGAETVRSAMAFVRNSDAIIFDLRENGGGDPHMVALISSYLFGDEPVHLNDLYWRNGDETREFWTDPKHAEFKMPNTPGLCTDGEADILRRRGVFLQPEKPETRR
jgi:retinol-binding protein 3